MLLLHRFLINEITLAADCFLVRKFALKSVRIYELEIRSRKVSLEDHVLYEVLWTLLDRVRASMLSTTEGKPP